MQILQYVLEQEVALNAFYVDAPEQKAGIFTTNPSATLDVNGDAQVQGSLTVAGDPNFY